MLITKKFVFDAAHKLIDYPGKCKELHGHTYVLFVTVKGSVDKKSGMVIDFSWLSQIVNREVVETLDHHFLNEIIGQPTAENISIWIWKRLKKHFNVYKIELQETPGSSVTYYGK